MKKIICILIIVALCLCSLCACSAKDSDKNIDKQNVVKAQFGEFGYNGICLFDYAIKSITAEEAKQILPDRDNGGFVISKELPLSCLSAFGEMALATSDFELPEDVLTSVMMNYAGITITTKYYLDNSDDIHTKTDRIVGTDFKSIIVKNEYVPFNQLVAKNIVAYDELIDYMEEQNRIFQSSESGLIAPFKAIFSYHTNDAGNLIIQTRDFAEIASSIGGGIGCSYRQDTEIVYDEEGKMILWQTSLGVSSSAPQGTMGQGYILEMNIEWIDKE